MVRTEKQSKKKTHLYKSDTVQIINPFFTMQIAVTELKRPEMTNVMTTKLSKAMYL